MTGLLSAFGKAVSFTARGATVTFGSTVFSCVAACSIEKGANRMILKYYPHKFANVESASGITKEELDFVKMMYGGRLVAAATNEETDSDSSTTTTNKDAEVVFRFDSFDESNTMQTSQEEDSNSKARMSILLTERNATQEREEETSAANKFWTEGEEAASKALSLIPAIIVPRQEILACSMTA